MADILGDDAFVRLFQERFGLEVDGFAGNTTLATLNAIKPATALPSDGAAIPKEYWPLLSKIESGDRPYVKAQSSSGSGLYQFLKATWIGEGGTWGDNPTLAFGGLKPSADEQLQRAKTFTAKNANYLRRNNIPINCASLYAAHFFGPVVAAKIIQASVFTQADSIAGPGATAANPSILKNKTVGEFLTWLHLKTGAWAR